ncbi:transcriptional regulator, LuxR family [Chloroflexus aggregans DSM 9485]|uniref:Transcriptional regulator, LuxR family n=2 Tax=Chloroflexus aggregans TaxID=152260 RepID=B8G731_CHLAD|nr:transcriptional regulator, LuxR family [Chloroflexus aggregans DSM 9485]
MLSYSKQRLTNSLMTTSHSTTLIATLGGQPQVITFALDALLAQGEAINEVYILHLSLANPRIRQAWQRLQAEFVDDYYAGQRCRLRHVPITRNGIELDDIRTEADADAAFATIRDLITNLKTEGRRLHLCISGGRRMLALLVTSVISIYGDFSDRLWHMHTPEATLARVKDGAQMHVSPADGVRLIAVPLKPWGAFFPGLRVLTQQTSLPSYLRQLTAVDDPRCRQVWDRLSPRERDVLRAFAQGFRPDQVAERLSISLSTVNTHKTAILAECRNAWELSNSEPLDYRFIRDHFAMFIEGV